MRLKDTAGMANCRSSLIRVDTVCPGACLSRYLGSVQYMSLYSAVLLQDKGNPDVTTKVFNSIPFNAEFADDNSNYAMITTMNGVDGFVMDVDPLFKVWQHLMNKP